MQKKRNWKSWGKRTKDELNGYSGVAGAGGSIMGIGGVLASILGGVSSTVLIVSGVGILLAVSAGGYALYKAIPPFYKSPEDCIGRRLTISELDEIYPRLWKIAIIGMSYAGKTTLLNRLKFDIPVKKSRTQEIHAHIVAIPTNPVGYLAILDGTGAGEGDAQQHIISELADCLCIILDHNRSDVNSTLSDDRFRETREFFVRTRTFLSEKRATRKLWIDILGNKRDLWQKEIEEIQNDFKDFCSIEVRSWRESNLAQTVSYHEHSNEVPDDIARFMQQLKNTVQTTTKKQ